MIARACVPDERSPKGSRTLVDPAQRDIRDPAASERTTEIEKRAEADDRHGRGATTAASCALCDVAEAAVAEFRRVVRLRAATVRTMLGLMGDR